MPSLRVLGRPLPQRYHFLLVFLHWVLAILISAALVIGNLKLSHIPNNIPEKLVALQGHMAVGVLILVLMLFRVGARLLTTHPASTEPRHGYLSRLALVMHVGMYILVLLQIASGIMLSAQSNLSTALFGDGAALPPSFTEFAPWHLHGWTAKALLVLILGHVAAAFYHQFIRKDELLNRMWFGRR